MTPAFRPISNHFNSSDLAVAAALLDYYGLPYTQRSLTDYLHQHVFGSLMTELADCLFQHGLNTTLLTAEPNLFTREVWKELYLLDYPKTLPDQLPSVNEVERIIKKGVLLRRVLPAIPEIDQELAAGRPVVISYAPALLDPLRQPGISQAILTPGDEQTYTVFEPLLDAQTTRQPKTSLLLAITQGQSKDPTARSVIFSTVRQPAPTAPPEPLPEI